MKKNTIFTSYIFYYNIFNIKIIFLFLNFTLIRIKTEVELPNFKIVYLSEDKYYIITQEKIFFYISEPESLDNAYIFNENQRISTEDEFERISFGKFKNTTNAANLLLVKNYLYAIIDSYYYCNTEINEIKNNSSMIFPFKWTLYTSYYIIGLINSKQLYLYLYDNPLGNCVNSLIHTFSINNIGSDNFSCQLMQTHSFGEVLTCFYQDEISNEIVSNSLKIDTTNKNIESVFSKYKPNNKAKIIKSLLSQDGTKSYVCYINNDNNCDCLIYTITTNEWSEINTYINGCLSKSSSFFFDYYDMSDEYFVYCYQTNSKINILKLNENLGIINHYSNDVYYSVEKCSTYFLSSLIYDSNNIMLFKTCNLSIFTPLIGKFPNNTIIITTIITTPETTIITTLPETTIITTLPETTIITTLPETTIISNMPTSLNTLSEIITTSITTILTSYLEEKTTKINDSSNQILIPSSIIKKDISSNIITNIQTSYFDYNNKDTNNLIIIQEKSNKTKEEIINNIDYVMKDYDIGKIYEIFGDDYNIKISPINTKTHENISTYIDFSNCENLLREENGLLPSDILTIYQIEIDNPNEETLVKKVEYAVFNENKERLDLLVCKDEIIEINYKLNTSLINMTKINYYSQLGIDIFNIEDEFFNDICYSYSENDSDMILKDRVEYIYENYSICENNCDYEKINLNESIVTCKCSVKTNSNTEIEKPKLDQIIRDSFTDSNLGVIKCYNLVFSMNNKIKNIGFCIFTFLIFIHMPLFIYYFIFNISSIRTFIFAEMNKYHYSYNVINPIKKSNKLNNKWSKKTKNNIQNDKILKTEINKKIAKKIDYRQNKKKKEYSTNSLLLTRNKKSYKNLIVNTNNYKNSPIYLNSNLFSNSTKSQLNVSEKNKNKNSKFNNKNKNENNIILFDYKYINKKYVNITNNNFNIQKNIMLNKKEYNNTKKNYSLIHIDANNSSNIKLENSNILLDNYDYSTAVKFDTRKFCRIFYICLIAKENILNIFLFRTPLDIFPLRICLFIFNYSSDLAFNTIFYSNENISEKYHYEGDNLFLFSLVNNLVQSIISTVVGFLLVNIFQHMIDFRGGLEDIFKKEEKKMRKSKEYKVNKERKLKILDKIKKLTFKLKIKIIFFITLEFLLMIFFYYFVTAFCEVYKNTQISWLYDFFMSFIMSFCVEIIFAFLLSLSYLLSIKYKKKFIYKITIFLYNI